MKRSLLFFIVALAGAADWLWWSSGGRAPYERKQLASAAIAIPAEVPVQFRVPTREPSASGGPCGLRTNDPAAGDEDVAAPEGVVRGVVLDELDGLPVPFLEMSVDGEHVETDANGAFVTAEKHEGGRLEIAFPRWSFEVDWSPVRAEPLIVPARIGPTYQVVLDRSAGDLWAYWRAPGWASSRQATALGEPALLHVTPPTFVRLEAEEGAAATGGEIVIASVFEFLAGHAELGPGRGSSSDPIPVSLSPCGFLSVHPELSRSREWYEQERMTLALLSREGSLQASMEWNSFDRFVFVVSASGEHWLEARYEGQTIGRVPVKTFLGQGVDVVLPVALPEVEPEASSLEPVSIVRARVTSARNLPGECELRLLRLSDDEEELMQVRWDEEGGRWVGHAEGEAPAGEYRAVLEPSTPFAFSGPATVHVPAAEELTFSIDDDVPLVDVYFEPISAETGAPLLSFDVDAFLAGGNCAGGAEYCSPSVPALEDYPRNVPFFWICSAPGRRPACGRWQPDGGEGDLHLPATLERGWGRTVFVGDSDCMALDGVRVLCDGVPAAVTDPSGRACIGGERPRRITLEYRGWILDPDNPGDLEPDGSFEEPEPCAYLVAYLKPRGGR